MSSSIQHNSVFRPWTLNYTVGYDKFEILTTPKMANNVASTSQTLLYWNFQLLYLEEITALNSKYFAETQTTKET